MRRIAVVGSGVVGLLAAHGLLKVGCAVDLYTDRSGEQWLNESKPTGAAVRFGRALEYEHELGLDFWNETAPNSPGVNFVLCLQPGTPFLELNGRFKQHCLTVDVRLQSSRWLEEFERRGGSLFIESVDLARLDQIAAEHDLTIVASGKGDLTSLFPVDTQRSVYTKPQRHLSMVLVTNANDTRDLNHAPVRFYEVPSAGETIWVPFYHKTLGQSWILFSEARAGSVLDRFRGVKSGEELLGRYKQMIQDIYPWDWEWAKDMTLSDPNGWLVGEITPTVRKPVGRLPSGRVVTVVGDAAILFDPIGAQGANTGNKMSRHIAQAVAARGDAPFDEAWIEHTFESFYQSEGGPAYDYNNLLLEGIPGAGQELLAAQYGSDGRIENGTAAQKIANAFADGFSDPRGWVVLLTDVKHARALISQHTGGSAMSAVMKGRAAVIWNQVRWRLGARGKFGFQHQVWQPARE
jgi:hypothetical protein